jgi:hypothetical protein
VKAATGMKSLAFRFEEINEVKGKEPSLLFTEIKLTSTSDEVEECFVDYTRSSKSCLTKTSHPTSECVVSFTFNQKEYLLGALCEPEAPLHYCNAVGIQPKFYFSVPFEDNFFQCYLYYA